MKSAALRQRTGAMVMKTAIAMIFFAMSLVSAANAQTAVVLASATTTGADNYTIQLQGSNFGASAYVDVRYASSGSIMAQYIGAPPLTRWTSGGSDYLSFVVTDQAQRNQLNSGGLFFWVVNPTTSTFDGPKQVVRVPPANQAPTVTITAPAANSSFTAPASITINASASDPDGNGIQRVDFYNGTTLLGQDTSAPYSYTWSGVATGSYTLRAIALDGLGLPSTASTVAVTVTPPTTSVVLAAARTTGADNYTIELDGSNFGTAAYVNIIYPGTSNIAAQYIGSPPLTRWTAGGVDHLSFVVTDPAQRTQFNAGGFNLYVVNQTNGTWDGPKLLVRTPPTNLPPTVAITAPATNSTYQAPATIAISATASDPDGNGVQRVDFYSGLTLLVQDTTAPYSYSWSNVSSGNYTIRAIAYDGLGVASTQSTISVSVTPAPVQTALNRGGSNYVWYYVGPASQDCPREDYAVINDYHRPSPFAGGTTVRALVNQQLTQMYQSGQRSIAFSLFISDAIPSGYGIIDKSGVQQFTLQSFVPSIATQYLTNLRNLISDSVAVGFSDVTIRFVWAGSNSPNNWTGSYQSSTAASWQRAISDTRAAIAGTGANYNFDLGGELMPPEASEGFPLWNRWARETWSWYVSNYGSSDSVGYSIPSGAGPFLPISAAKADLRSRLRNTQSVYGSNYPPLINIHFYEQPTVLFAEADSLMDSIGKSAVPFKIGETFYNDATTASALKQASLAANRSIDRLIQWPLLGPQRGNTSTPNCDHVQVVPLDFSGPLSQGF